MSRCETIPRARIYFDAIKAHSNFLSTKAHLPHVTRSEWLEVGGARPGRTSMQPKCGGLTVFLRKREKYGSHRARYHLILPPEIRFV